MNSILKFFASIRFGPAVVPVELDIGPNSEISFSESGDGDPVRYKSTAVPADDPPKTESTVYVQLYR